MMANPPHSAPREQDRLRLIPSVGELLSRSDLAPLASACGREPLGEWIEDALEELRAQLRAGGGPLETTRAGFADRVARGAIERAEAEQAVRLGPVVNATGVVLHTGLGRAPLSDAALRAVQEAGRASNLEVDLATGDRRWRGHQLQNAWRRLTGAEGAFVVNNNAAATVLLLDALCRGREVVISRGQLIEIGGSFRLPEIFAQSGAILREVGTTNRTRLADYERVIGPQTAAILHVHTSNYRVVGFAETPGTEALAKLAKRAGVLCFDDIGSGCLVDTTRFDLPHEPTFAESLQAGADLVLGSGDKLLGGPQCGIVLGREALLARLREHPLARAVRIDKLTLAALAATLDSYLRGTAIEDIPVLSLLGAKVEDLLSRASRIREALGSGIPGSPAGTLSITVDRETAMVGGGSLPGATLPTAVLRLTHATLPVGDFARRLRLGTPRVFGRIRENEVLLDLRSVLPGDDGQIVAALRAFEGNRGNE